MACSAVCDACGKMRPMILSRAGSFMVPAGWAVGTRHDPKDPGRIVEVTVTCDLPCAESLARKYGRDSAPPQS
jgi:hypothetical protein